MVQCGILAETLWGSTKDIVSRVPCENWKEQLEVWEVCQRSPYSSLFWQAYSTFTLGARFSGWWVCFFSQFGGKLVTFEHAKVQPQQGAEPQQQRQHVFISQVVTEKDFLSRSEQLQQVVQSQSFTSYCQRKIDASQTEFEKNVWSFLKVKLGLLICFCMSLCMLLLRRAHSPSQPSLWP